MLAGNWFGKKRFFSGAKKTHRLLKKAPRRKDATFGRNLRVEELEDRRLLAVYVVNNLGDLDGDANVITGTLRQAINLSNASQDETDTIVFADFLFTNPNTRQTMPGTITLDGRPEGQQLTITDEVRILGPGAAKLTIQAGGTHRIFETNIDSVEEVRPVAIGGVTLAGGSLVGTTDDDANRGGAIFNRESLTIIETEFVNNSASWGGGAIYSPIGSVNVTRSLFEGNSSGGGGGAILHGELSDDERPPLTVVNSTFFQNSTTTAGFTDPAPGYGGAIYNRNGNATISHNTFTGNSASSGGGGVATNGVDIGDGEDPPAPIRTALTHNVLFGNSGVGGADDIFAVREMRDGNEVTLLAPTMLIDGPGLGYNVIGAIGGTAYWDPNDEDNPGNDHFYQVLGNGGALTRSLANLLTTYGQVDPPIPDPLPDDLSELPALQGSHLATPSTMAENMFVAELIDDPRFWTVFQPTVTIDIPPDPNDPDDMGSTEEQDTTPPESIGPWFGGIQTDFTAELEMMIYDQGWQWVTAPREEWTDTNWFDMPAGMPPLVVPVQPNNGVRDGQDTPGPAESFTAYFGEAADENTPVPTDTWGDFANEPEGEESPIAFVLEYDAGTNLINVDPSFLNVIPLDFGGATRTFYPNSFNDSPLIDAGDPLATGVIEQRGVHFTRVADGDLDGLANIDIGAVEVQNGQFIVDTLFDESDSQFTVAFGQDGIDEFDVQLSSAEGWYTSRGDFALREALDFSEKNPEFDFISFSDSLILLEDPTSSPAPTILLKLNSGIDVRSAFAVTQSVSIAGPTGFELELDASGNDLTPTVNNSDGTRIFMIDDFDSSFLSSMSISGLTLLGGDVVGEGGAILNREDLDLDRVSIKENFASLGGGGISTSDGELIISSSALVGNTAAFEGGALKLDSSIDVLNVSKATVRNSTISGNQASRGSGIVNENGELLVEFSTISDNTGLIGAGVANVNNPNTFTQFRSSIVAANNGDDIRILQSAVPNVQSLGFNLIGSGNALSVFTQAGDLPGVLDPMISPLVFEGGFTPVHRLEPGSPAIDAGESTAAAGVGIVPEFDQRGAPFTRVFDGVQDTKDRIDIGAYELQGTTFIVDSPADENDGNISTGNLSLREAVELSNANPLPDVIMFNAAALAGQTIFQSPKGSFALQPNTPTDIRITDSVTIVGLGQSLLTLDGSGAFTDLNTIPPVGEPIQRSRFFTIDDSDHSNDLQVSISGLTFTGSVDTTANGAVVKSHEDLTLSDITFTSNSTLGDGFNGGALYQRYGSLELDGVTLTANTTDGVDADGGAVYVRDADATIVNSVISGNSTAQTLGSGGGIYIRGGTLDMTYTTVSSNLTPGGEADGAGLFGFESALNINNSYITGNSMTGSNSEGAGIHSKDSTLTLTNSFVGLNSTTGTQSEGAGIYINGGSATIDRTSVSLNTTSGLIAVGGGIAVVDADLLVQSSTLDRNSTSGGVAPGGGIHNLGGNVTILDSTISGNSASGLGSRGGGVYSNTPLVGSERTLILNSTVSGNSAADTGGGVYNSGGLTEIRHSTITNNSVPFFGNGGGVATLGTAASTTTRVYSSIIAGNFASSDPANPITDVDATAGAGQNSFESLGYNVIGRGLLLALDGFNGVGDQTGVDDPMLGILTFNGGPTFTHAPLENSPVINAGDPAAVPGFASVPLFDQRGSDISGTFPRLVAGRIDVGAVESPFAGTAGPDFDSDGDVDGSDFLAWQRGFGTLAASKSDGDANSDGNVNNVDLAMWQSAYGDVSALAASSTGGDDRQFAASSHAESEPPAAAAVLSADSADPVLDALIARTLEVRSDADEVTVQAPQAAEQVVVRDQLFAALSRRGEYRDDDGVDQLTTESSENDLEVSLEDRIFDWLGA